MLLDKICDNTNYYKTLLVKIIKYGKFDTKIKFFHENCYTPQRINHRYLSLYTWDWKLRHPSAGLPALSPPRH